MNHYENNANYDESVTPDNAPVPTKVERTWAMFAHLAGLAGLVPLVPGFGSIVAPLIIYLLKKEESNYIAFHALQSMVYQIVIWAIVLVVGLSSFCLFLLIGIPIIITAGLAGIIYPIVGAVKVSNGEEFEYWFIGDVCRKMRSENDTEISQP